MPKPKNYFEIVNDDVAPNSSDQATYLQRISSKVGAVRDRAIVLTIEKMLNQFSRVLVVYGSSHQLTQGPALEATLGPPQFFNAN